MTSLLTNSINNENKTNTYILELRRHNIKVDIPDINVSCQNYIINNKNIVCPLSIIRNVFNLEGPWLIIIELKVLLLSSEKADEASDSFLSFIVIFLLSVSLLSFGSFTIYI